MRKKECEHAVREYDVEVVITAATGRARHHCRFVEPCMDNIQAAVLTKPTTSRTGRMREGRRRSTCLVSQALQETCPRTSRNWCKSNGDGAKINHDRVRQAAQ